FPPHRPRRMGIQRCSHNPRGRPRLPSSLHPLGELMTNNLDLASTPNSAADTPALRIVNLHKHFGGVIAVKSFDLEVSPGEFVALVGDNGAGKSTLVKMNSGVYSPTG